MKSGIYKIINLLDEKVYIGSSKNIQQRQYKHFWLLNKNCHDNSHLQNAYNKFGEKNFIFDVIELCVEEELASKENYYIKKYNSNNSTFGYNLTTVTELRKNNFNYEIKKKLSKYNLKKNANFTSFYLENIITNEIKIFDNLVDAANYLIENGFSKGNPRNVRQKLSTSLRKVKVNNGRKNYGSIRKTVYKHKFDIIN